MTTASLMRLKIYAKSLAYFRRNHGHDTHFSAALGISKLERDFHAIEVGIIENNFPRSHYSKICIERPRLTGVRYLLNKHSNIYRHELLLKRALGV
mgnify:CR=1 FL=1